MLPPLHPQFDFDKETPFLIGVSGGSDSIALASLLMAHGYQNLTLIHINHSLRGADSLADQLFCEQFAQTKGLKFEAYKYDVAKIAEEENLSIEVAARKSRHDAFAQASKKRATHATLVGHHQDDLVETTLLNLARGSAGLKGIPFTSTIEVPSQQTSLQLIRPILHLTKSDLQTYLKSINQNWREDTSNEENFTPRNTLRNKIIPQLNDLLNRDASSNIARAAQTQSELQDALDEAYPLSDFLDPQGRLFLPKFNPLPLAFRKHLLKHFFQKEKISNISHRQIQEACEVLASSTSPASVNLSKNNRISRRQQRGFIERAL